MQSIFAGSGLQIQQNLRQVFLGVLKGNSLVASDILFSLLVHPPSSLFIRLFRICWTCKGFPMTAVFISSSNATDSAGHHHSVGHSTHQQVLLPPPASQRSCVEPRELDPQAGKWGEMSPSFSVRLSYRNIRAM